jgi:hypothetical protein
MGLLVREQTIIGKRAVVRKFADLRFVECNVRQGLRKPRFEVCQLSAGGRAGTIDMDDLAAHNRDDRVF